MSCSTTRWSTWSTRVRHPGPPSGSSPRGAFTDEDLRASGEQAKLANAGGKAGRACFLFERA